MISSRIPCMLKNKQEIILLKFYQEEKEIANADINATQIQNPDHYY